MAKFISNLFSYFFHPLLMPTLGFFIFFNTGSYLSFMPIKLQYLMLGMIFLTTCIIPLTFIPFMLNLKIISSYKLDDLGDRFYPFFTSFISFGMAFYLLWRMPFQVPWILRGFILGAALSVLLITLISLKWKISAHMTGIGGLVGGLIALSIQMGINLTLIISISVLIAGVLGFSRLYLKAHNPLQVYAGFVLGLSCVAGVLWFA